MNHAPNQGDELRGLSPAALMVIVCIAGGGVGAFFGLLVAPLGVPLGALGGVVAGIVWTRIMLFRAHRGYGRARLIAAGTVWGMVVGLLATVILHGGLAIAGHPITRAGEYVSILEIAVVCAVIGGAFTGFVCGWFVPMRPRAGSTRQEPPPAGQEGSP